jgi:type II secretory pathway pseudopilin PulG
MKNLILILLVVPTFIFSQNKKEERKATISANTWLTQIDNGQYLDSWDNADKYFQNQIQQDRWSAALTAGRLPLGKLISKRKLDSSDYKTELPGAPDGKYYIFTFDVSYENKNKALETITLIQDSEGDWKVVGFFIK